MPNSNSKASIASRALTAKKWTIEKRKLGLIKQLNITLTNPNTINKINNLKITKTKFIDLACEILNENGEIK